ncbi:hypothetical protein BZG02_07825 [Labilibaculum filiforme]|uniref:RagB/SusD family nutrient uptake outer membrane protein n=2 Tax=Labilibaculum filiforme TaxID=1940526 RepID=A0A2N3I0R4_9BACT|nr:hypothetical protein BZG02_07825 [Labilibaculum filiforme]
MLVACNDWLDVTPLGDVKADDLITTTNGMNSAVAGVYYLLTETEMYGQDMSYASYDVLGQYYDIKNIEHDDYALSKFNYMDNTVRTRIDGWWSNYYECIGQCNKILEAFNDEMPEIQNAELFKGEVLALRAFCHLQVYRVFGPVTQNVSDLEQKAIPYRTEFNNVATSFSNCKQVLDFARTDLLEAVELMKGDPITTGGKRDDLNDSQLSYNNILVNRVARLNYYGVMGLLSRVEQLSFNQSQEDGAYYWANRLLEELESNTSIALSGQEVTDGKDKMFSSEIIFSLSRNDLWDLTEIKLGPNLGIGEDVVKLQINGTAYNELVTFVYGRQPDGSGSDYRLVNWFDQVAGNNSYPLVKYTEPLNNYDEDSDYSYPEIAIIRLSEVYYTMCEALIGVDNVKALEYLNAVRTKRGMFELEASEAVNVETYLMRERRKEFFGDGEIFFINKRLFKPIEASSSNTVMPSKEIFELPIPEDEYEFGPEGK